MAQTNVIPSQKIEDAAAGNQALREILQGLANTTNQQQTVTSTTGKNVPPQVKAQVSFLKGNYIVEIQNPGTVTPTSSVQAALATGGATAATNTAPLTAIYHQIRCATSPQFNISSAVTTFGGTTGSTQTYWTLTNLPSGRFYFQVRSSYDGINFNLWRNANGGQTITNQPDGVTVEATTNAVFGLFTLPGQQLVAFGAGLASSGDTFGVPQELYTSAMQAIPGPNGFNQSGSAASHGITENSISIVGNTDAQSGPPDFPTLVTMTYEDGGSHHWTGSSSIFAFCYDPLGTNVTEQSVAGGVWVDFILPGGAHLTIGSGVGADASNIVLPSNMPWVQPATMMHIVSPQSGISVGNHAHGIKQADLFGTTLACGFGDGSGNYWSAVANWFVVSYSEYPNIELVANGQWIVITLSGGSKVAIGAGKAPSGTAFGLPAGFTSANMLAIATPASYNDIGDDMAGVAQCGIIGTTPFLTYSDAQSGNTWDGDCNWMGFAWT